VANGTNKIRLTLDAHSKKAHSGALPQVGRFTEDLHVDLSEDASIGAEILTYFPLRQFGNMLVLSATYISSLKELVEPEQLKRLLARTIWFLKYVSIISIFVILWN
jgi:hypothetical protein